MKMRPGRYGLCLVLAACGSSANPAAQSGSANPQVTPSGPRFAVQEITTFNFPWAMDFLPGFSVTMASREPGRKSIAQGELNLVTSRMVNRGLAGIP